VAKRRKLSDHKKMVNTMVNHKPTLTAMRNRRIRNKKWSSEILVSPDNINYTLSVILDIKTRIFCPSRQTGIFILS
jgi:hypothetical protein